MRAAISFCCLLRAARYGLEPFAGAAHRKLRDFADMLAADLDAQRLRLEPVAVTGLAGNVGEIFRQFLARPLALGLAIPAVDVGDDPLERLFGIVGAHAVFVGEFDLVFSRTMQDGALRLLRQVLPLGVERELVELCQRGQGLDVIGRGRFRPRCDRALAQGQFLVGNDQIFVDMLLDAEAAAGRAGAIGVVEGEQSRLDFRNREAGNRAGEFFREQNPLRPALVVDFCGLLVGFLLVGLFLAAAAAGASAYSITASPSASFSAVSKLSASRWPMSGRTTMRSTTTSMSCGNFLSSVGASASS